MDKRKVWTAHGLMNVEPNGIAQKGESLWNPSTNAVQYIDKGKDGVDDQLVNVQDETFIPSNALGLDKIMEPHARLVSKIQDKMRKNQKNNASDSLAKYTQKIQQRELDKYINTNIKPIADLQENIHSQQQSAQFDKGKNSTKIRSSIGAFGRMFPAIASLSAGLGQLAHWGTNKINYHNTYAENPYSTLALGELNKLRHNPYPEIQASQDAERRAAYANEQAGGLSGGQKYLGRIALGIGGMRNAANIYANAQQQNNAYRSQYANALLQEGNSVASRRQNANQHDWSDFVAAHGAKTRGIEQATANIIGAINGAYQNEFKYRTWQDTLDMYRDQQQIDKDRLNADIEEAKARRSTNYNNYPGFTPAYQYMLTNGMTPGGYNYYNFSRPFIFKCGKDRKR